MQNTSVKKTVIVCSRASEIPKEKHWAILETRSGTEKGYDPGDPDTHFNFMAYTAFLNKDEWEKEVVKRTEANHKAFTKTDFIGIEVQAAVVNTTVAISVGMPE